MGYTGGTGAGVGNFTFFIVFNLTFDSSLAAVFFSFSIPLSQLSSYSEKPFNPPPGSQKRVLASEKKAIP